MLLQKVQWGKILFVHSLFRHKEYTMIMNEELMSAVLQGQLHELKIVLHEWH